jgi:PKD repeat protein
MKNKGVTLVSLTIYVIVAVMLIGALAFININFMSQTSELSKRTKIVDEYAKFSAFFIEDVKANNTILDYTSKEIRFPNGRKYTIKQVGEHFEVYVDSIKITEDLIDANFDYDIEHNCVMVSFKFTKGKNIIINSQSYLLGRGY